jgi:multidrug efflux pump
MVTKPWNRAEEEHGAAADGRRGRLLDGARRARVALVPPSLPGGSGTVDMVIMSTAGPEQLLAIANELVGKAYASGKFYYVDTDLKYDQPQTEIVFDRDKVRSLGVDMSQVGEDLSRLLGGNFVNRFSVQGRSYKVIPQIKRSERLPPNSSSRCTSPVRRLACRAPVRHAQHDDAAAQAQLPAAERGAHQAVIPPTLPLEDALTFLETNAKQMLPRGYSIDFAGESRQLRTEGGKFLGVFLLSAILIFLVLAAQFESFRDPFVILVGSAPLALSGSLMFMFLGFTSLNIYSRWGFRLTLSLVAKNAS